MHLEAAYGYEWEVTQVLDIPAIDDRLVAPKIDHLTIDPILGYREITVRLVVDYCSHPITAWIASCTV